MAVLDQLTFSNAAPKRDTSPAGRFRRRMIEAIDVQLAMVEAEAAGSELRLTRKRWIKNEAGVKELREVPKRLRRWWWTDDAGVVHLGLRHADRPLAVAPGKVAIEVGTMADLPAKLAILREAVRAGELDGCLVEGRPRGSAKPAKGDGKAPEASPSRKGARKPEEGVRASA